MHLDHPRAHVMAYLLDIHHVANDQCTADTLEYSIAWDLPTIYAEARYGAT